MANLANTKEIENLLNQLRKHAENLIYHTDYCLKYNDETDEGSVDQYLDDSLKKVDEFTYNITQVINKLRTLIDDETDKNGNPINAYLRWYSSGY